MAQTKLSAPFFLPGVIVAASKNKVNTNIRADRAVESKELEEKKSWAERIAEVLKRVEGQLDFERSSVSDYLRLITALRECEGEAVRDLTVRWVEVAESE